jgi:hypothetical protein
MARRLAEDFIRPVLDLDRAWISDESSLWDFHTNETKELLYAKMRRDIGGAYYSVSANTLRAIAMSTDFNLFSGTIHGL